MYIYTLQISILLKDLKHRIIIPLQLKHILYWKKKWSKMKGSKSSELKDISDMWM